MTNKNEIAGWIRDHAGEAEEILGTEKIAEIAGRLAGLCLELTPDRRLHRVTEEQAAVLETELGIEINEAERVSEQAAAEEIVEQMSAEDIAGYDSDAWREGVAVMLTGHWADLDLEDVLEAIGELCAERTRLLRDGGLLRTEG